MLVYEGFELLDLAGPSSVFTNAASVLRRKHQQGSDAYRTLILSSRGGTIQAQDGVQVASRAISKFRIGRYDTVLVVGGEQECVKHAAQDACVLKFLARASERAERVASVCTGALILAASGVTRGKTVTTHWNCVDSLASQFSDVTVCNDSLYVNDGSIWTSAGVSTGIDMSLAMVELDHGRSVMGQVAQVLVLHSRRPGYQTQFSPILRAQTSVSDKFDDLTRWLQERLAQPIRIDDMAEKMAMSKRTFCRHFSKSTGYTPADFLLRLRMDHARDLLEAGDPVKSVAVDVGFSSESGFRRAFEALFGVAPSAHQSAHAQTKRGRKL